MDDRIALLREAIGPVRLSADEERLISWCARILDHWALPVLCGLMKKIRLASVAAAIEPK